MTQDTAEKDRAYTAADIDTIKSIIERMVSESFVTGLKHDTDKDKDSKDEDVSSDTHFITTHGSIDVNDLMSDNGITDGVLSEKPISVVRMTNMVEPTWAANQKETLQEEQREEMEEGGLEWARRNWPDLAAEATRKNGKLELAYFMRYGADYIAAAFAERDLLRNSENELADMYEKYYGDKEMPEDKYSIAREILVYELNSGELMKLTENMQDELLNMRPEEIRKMIREAREIYLRIQYAELAKDYFEYDEKRQSVENMSVDQLVDEFAKEFNMSRERAESRVTEAVTGRKNPVETARHLLYKKYYDKCEGFMMLADMGMKYRELLSEDVMQKLEKNVSDIIKQNAHEKKYGAEIIKNNIEKLDDRQIISEIADAKNITEQKASEEYLADPVKAKTELINIRIRQRNFNNKSFGENAFRKRNKDDYNGCTFEIFIPVAIIDRGKPVIKMQKMRVGGKRKEDVKFSYDPQSGKITFDKPIVMPKNVAVSNQIGMSYNMKRYSNIDAEDKPFKPTRISGMSSIKDIISYDPETGMPQYAAVAITMHDWKYIDVGEIFSNAPIEKDSKFYMASVTAGGDVEDFSTASKDEIAARLHALSDDEFARKYADVFKQDYDTVRGMLDMTQEEMKSKLDALKKKMQGTEQQQTEKQQKQKEQQQESTEKQQETAEKEFADFAELAKRAETQEDQTDIEIKKYTAKYKGHGDRGKMTLDLINALSGRIDDFHVGLVVYDKKDEEKLAAPKNVGLNYWVRFKVIVEPMSKYKSDEAAQASDKIYTDSKKMEMLSAYYRYMLDKVKSMDNEERAEKYAEITGETPERAAEMQDKSPAKFIDDLAWLMYDNDIVDAYVKTFSTRAKKMSKETAKEALENDRIEAIDRLNKKIREELPETDGKDQYAEPATKAREMKSSHYKYVREKVGAMRADERAEKYAELTNMNVSDAKKIPNIKSDEFADELAWLMHVALVKKIDDKIRSTNYGKAPKYIGIDPISKKKIVDVPIGMDDKSFMEWRAKNAESPKATGSEIKRLLLSRDGNGNYKYDDKDIAEFYALEFEIDASIAKNMLTKGLRGDDETIAKNYARMFGIGIDDAKKQVLDDKSTVMSRIRIKNRVDIVNKIAESVDAETAARKLNKSGKKYRATSNDKNALRNAYVESEMFAIMKMPTEDLYKAYSELSGIDVQSSIAMHEKSPESFMEKIKAAVVKEANDMSINEIKDILDQRGITAYAISNEELARQAEKTLGMTFDTAFMQVMSNREDVIEKLERASMSGQQSELRAAEIAGETPVEKAERRKTYHEHHHLEHGRAASTGAVEKFRDSLDDMTVDEIIDKFGYKFDAEPPKDRKKLTDALVDMHEDMLKLKMAGTEKSESAYRTMLKADNVKKALHKYMSYLAELDDADLFEHAIDALKYDAINRERIQNHEVQTRDEIIEILRANKSAALEKIY